VAGDEAQAAVDWMNASGFDAKYLGPKPGSASSVKMVRSVLMKGLEALGVEALVTAERQGIREEVLECLADVDLVPFREHLSSLVQTHVVHARRRWEEMGLVAQTLRETGVEPKMTVTTEQTLRRSVEAGIAPADGKVPKLDEALKLLSEKVVRGR
jgi:3-hydroxyisobutyrate dehydrogenase-like beta-hydroxyacid dehydrogenase